MPHVLHHPHIFHWPTIHLPRLRLGHFAGRVVFFILAVLMARLEWGALRRMERFFGGKGRSLARALEEAEEE